jgi:hypothetical protein
MATNSDALQAMSDERRGAVASTENPEGGIWPVGGDPVPGATTAVENTDPADTPSGKIENSSATVDDSPAADDGDIPDVGKPAVSDDAAQGEPPVRRRANSTRASQA